MRIVDVNNNVKYQCVFQNLSNIFQLFRRNIDTFLRHLFCKLRKDIKLLNLIKMVEITLSPARQLINVITYVFFSNGL